MQVEVTNQRIRPGALFKVIALGYWLGALAIFAPFFVLFAAGGLFGSPAFDGRFSPWLMLILLPVITGFQGVIFGALATLGLWIFTRFRHIEVFAAGDGR